LSAKRCQFHLAAAAGLLALELLGLRGANSSGGFIYSCGTNSSIAHSSA